VLTDGTVFCSSDGEELLVFSRRDGLGFERLADAGVETAIITREASPIVERRARKLATTLHAGVRDKRRFVEDLLAARALPLSAVAYIGDDVNDLGVMHLLREQGLVAAPADAEPAVLAAAHVVTHRRGGHGAFRELAELVLSERPERRPP
jgi:3-deoxy-D-manno-octulosonate 8-phosphate phosphatase (KDO 8-P phosphatase)